MLVWMEEQAIQTEDESNARQKFLAIVAAESAKLDRMMADPDYLAAQQDLPPHMR